MVTAESMIAGLEHIGVQAGQSGNLFFSKTLNASRDSSSLAIAPGTSGEEGEEDATPPPADFDTGERKAACEKRLSDRLIPDGELVSVDDASSSIESEFASEFQVVPVEDPRGGEWGV